MVAFEYDGVTRRFPAASDFISEQMEKYILGTSKDEGFVELIEQSINLIEARDNDPKQLTEQLKGVFEELLENPLTLYLKSNRQAYSSFVKRRPEKRKEEDEKMLAEASLKNIEEDNPEFDEKLVAQLSGTVVSDIANVGEQIRKDIVAVISQADMSDEEFESDSLSLGIESEIRFRTAKTITGEKKLSFSKSNNRGFKNAHSVMTFPTDDGMEELITKAQNIIVRYTGAEVTFLPKRGKVLIDSAIDKEGIKNAIKFSSMNKYIEDGEIKDGLQFDYKFIDELNLKLEQWFDRTIGDEYFNTMVQDGTLYQLMVEASFVREQKKEKTLTEKVKETLPDDDGKIKDKYSKFTALKYRIPKAFAINLNFDVTAEEEYPLIPMEEYRIPDRLKGDSEENKKARQKIYNKLKEERQKITAQYNELRAATTEIEVDGNKYLLIFSDSPVYKKAEEAYDKFGFGNNKIRMIVHSFFDEKFEMIKKEGTGKFKDKALFDSDFQGQERLKYAYIDRRDEPITEAEARQIEQGDFRVVQEEYGEAFSDYIFYRKDKVKQTDIGKYADLGLNEEQRAELYYKFLTGTLDDRTEGQKLLEGFSDATRRLSSQSLMGRTKQERERDKLDSNISGVGRRLYKQDLDDISVEKKMKTKRWIKLYETNKKAAQIYILLPLVSETAVVEGSKIIEGSEFGKDKYEATAFTVEDLMQVEGDKKDKDGNPIMVDNEEDVSVFYSVYLKKYTSFNLSPLRGRGQNKAMREHLDDLSNRILDIRETIEGY
tara:strand:+ start:4505 stop:6817 length:2313 start_codon:yes stop_codon:yes gene_type:complete